MRREESLDNEILTELEPILRPIMVDLAKRYPMAGYDIDDLCQEMRIKAWKVIAAGKYDPNRCKPTSFFYRVFFRHLIDLKRKHKPGKDALDHAYSFNDEYDQDDSDWEDIIADNMEE